jgi:hypothetical protein
MIRNAMKCDVPSTMCLYTSIIWFSGISVTGRNDGARDMPNTPAATMLLAISPNVGNQSDDDGTSFNDTNIQQTLITMTMIGQLTDDSILQLRRNGRQR